MKFIDYVIVFIMVSCVIAWMVSGAISDIASVIAALSGGGVA